MRPPDDPHRVAKIVASLAFVVVLIGAMGAGLVAVGDALEGQDRLDPQNVLPILLVLGVLLLLAALAAYAVILKVLGIGGGDKQALGLPEGSIRAVLALALVLLFASTSAYLFFELQTPVTLESKGLNAEQLKALPPPQIIKIEPVPNSSPALVNVTVERGTEAASRIADQLVTVLATLLTAVVAFYFGASTVKDAKLRDLGADPK